MSRIPPWREAALAEIRSCLTWSEPHCLLFDAIIDSFQAEPDPKPDVSDSVESLLHLQGDVNARLIQVMRQLETLMLEEFSPEEVPAQPTSAKRKHLPSRERQVSDEAVTNVKRFLARCPIEGTTVSEICESIGLKETTVRTALHRLEGDNWAVSKKSGVAGQPAIWLPVVGVLERNATFADLINDAFSVDAEDIGGEPCAGQTKPAENTEAEEKHQESAARLPAGSAIETSDDDVIPLSEVTKSWQENRDQIPEGTAVVVVNVPPDSPMRKYVERINAEIPQELSTSFEFEAFAHLGTEKLWQYIRDIAEGNRYRVPQDVADSIANVYSATIRASRTLSLPQSISQFWDAKLRGMKIARCER